MSDRAPPSDSPPPDATAFGVVGAALSLLTPAERAFFSWLMVLSVVTAALDALAVAALPALVGGLIGGGAEMPGARLEWLLRQGRELVGDAPALAGLLLLGIYAAKNAMLWWDTRASARFSSRTSTRASRDLFAYLMRRPWVEHAQGNLARALRDVTTDPSALFGHALASFKTVVTNVLSLVAVILALTALSPALGLGTAALTLVLAGLLLLRARNSDTEHAVGRRQGVADMNRWAQEGLSAFKEVRVSGAEEQIIERFEQAAAVAAKATAYSAYVAKMPRLAVETFAVAGLAIALVVAQLASVEPAAMLALLVAFAGALARLVPAVQSITAALLRLRHVSSSVAVVPLLRAASRLPPPTTKEQPPPDEVRLDGVRFGYRPGVQVLDGVDLSLRRGERIALVGSSGAGKTTLVDVMLGLLQPATGRVLFDGEPRSDARLKGWAYIPQRVFLADDTLRNNVAFPARADVDDARVTDALDRAGLTKLLSSLPDGLDTRLGEAGALLSGGQAQRVGIARALYARPAFIVLDEAMSAVDAPTSQAVLDALSKIEPRPGVLVIAHRMSTVRACDRIELLADGHITARGTFDELAESSPAFQRLVGDELADDPPVIVVDFKRA